jgi:hypothetical protein
VILPGLFPGAPAALSAATLRSLELLYDSGDHNSTTPIDYNMPANTLAVGDGLVIFAAGLVQDAGQFMRLTLGGTTINTDSVSGTVQKATLAFLRHVGASSQVTHSFSIGASVATAVPGRITSAIDLTAVATLRADVGGANAARRNYRMWVCKARIP